MDNNIIYRCTDTTGKRITIRIREILEGWYSSIIPYKLFSNLVQLECCNTRRDMIKYLTECFSY